MRNCTYVYLAPKLFNEMLNCVKEFDDKITRDPSSVEKLNSRTSINRTIEPLMGCISCWDVDWEISDIIFNYVNRHDLKYIYNETYRRYMHNLREMSPICFISAADQGKEEGAKTFEGAIDAMMMKHGIKF